MGASSELEPPSGESLDMTGPPVCSVCGKPIEPAGGAAGDALICRECQQDQEHGSAAASGPFPPLKPERPPASPVEKTVSRSMILDQVWGMRIEPDTNVVDVHIYRLRGKIEKPGSTPLIRTIRGVGYVLRDK